MADEFIEVELPSGHVVEFPSTMDRTEVLARAGELSKFYGTHGRLPAKVGVKRAPEGAITTTSEGGERPTFKNLTDVARHGLGLVKQARAGEIDPTKLPPADVLAVRLALRDLKPSDLTAEDKGELGLPLSMFEQAKRVGSSVARGFRYEPEGAGLGKAARRGYEAGKATMTAPLEQFPASGRLLKTFEGDRKDPEWLRILRRVPYEAVGVVERVPAAALNAAAAASHEDPRQQEMNANLINMALMGSFPGKIPGAGGRLPGARSAARAGAKPIPGLSPDEPLRLRPELQPPPTVETLPTEGGGRYRMRATPSEGQFTGQTPGARTGGPLDTRMLEHGPAEQGTIGGNGFQILNNARATRRQLPPGAKAPPRALPPRRAAPEGVIEADYSVVSEGKNAPSGFDILKGVRGGRALSPGEAPAALPGAPAKELPPHINFERVPPPAPPKPGDLPFGGPLDPKAPPPDVGVRPAEGGSGLVPPPVQVTPTRHSVELSNPDQVVQWIVSEGGLKRTKGAKGELEGVPHWVFRKNGLALHELAQQLADARGMSAKAAENAIVRTLSRYKTLKAEQRRGAPPVRPAEAPPVSSATFAEAPLRESVNDPEPPAKYRNAIDAKEWASMSPKDRASVMDFFDSIGRTRPDLLAGLGIGTAGAAAAPYIIKALRGDAPDSGEGKHPIVGRLLEVLKRAASGAPEVAKDIGGLAMAAPLLGMGRGRGIPLRPGEMPRPGATAPPVSAWSESLLPPPPRGPGGPPPRPGMEPASPGPFRGVPPEHVDGTAARGLPEFVKQYAMTIMGRLETMGEGGQEVSRRWQLVQNQAARFYGQHAEPVLQQIRGLSSKEKANFLEAADTGAAPMNAKVAAAMREWERVAGPDGVVPKEARARNLFIETNAGVKLPFQGRPNFFPHEFAPEYVREVLRKNSPIRERAIERLIETGQVVGQDVNDLRSQAEMLLDDYFGAKVVKGGGVMWQIEPERMVGGLERAREINIDGWIKDPEVAIGIRMNKVARRLAELDHYGRWDDIIGHPGGVMDRTTRQPLPAKGLIGQIQQQFGVPEAYKAYTLFKRMVGQDPVFTDLGRLASTVQTAEVFTKIPLAVLLHLSQPALTTLRTNLATAFRGGLEMLFHPIEGRAYARQVGTLMRESIQGYYNDLTGISSPGRALQAATGPFNTLLSFNRVMATNAGRIWADTVGKRLGDPARRPWVGRELERLGFGRDEVAERLDLRRLHPEDTDRIAYAIADQAVFGHGRGRLSEFQTTPLGRFTMQFKFFQLNAQRLMNQAVIREARAGNYAPIARVLALFPLMGEVTNDVRSLARGTERPDDFGERILEDFLVVGGFSMVADLAERVAHYGARGFLEYFAGPGLSDAGRLAEISTRAAVAGYQGDTDKVQREMAQAGRFAVRQIPFVGPRLSQALRTDKAAEKRAQQTWQQRLGLDPVERELRRIEAEDKSRKQEQARANRLAAEGKMDEARDVIDNWARVHESAIGLNPGSIRRRQRQAASAEDPDRARLARLSPMARARALRELQEAGR